MRKFINAIKRLFKKQEKSNLYKFAENELSRLKDDEDGMQNIMNKRLLKMVKEFSKEGHSGFSANYVVNMLDRLLRWLPITAIKDKPGDWNKIGDGSYQHKRCSKIFKDKDRFNGQAYNSTGRVFSDDGGKIWFTNNKSHLPIEFPYYVPKYPFKYLVNKDGEIISEFNKQEAQK